MIRLGYGAETPERDALRAYVDVKLAMAMAGRPVDPVGAAGMVAASADPAVASVALEWFATLYREAGE